jgi:hypothetical protein
MSLRCDTTEEMEFQLKPRLDAMKWAFSKLKEKSDNLGFYILGLSLTISCIESIKLVLEMGDNKAFKVIPIVLSLGVGGLSAYTKKCNFNEKLELLLNSINDTTHILTTIRNADTITREIAEEYTRALGIIEGSTDPKSRGSFYKEASKNLISIQKQSLKYKAALDALEHNEVIISLPDDISDDPPTPKEKKPEIIIKDDEPTV